MFHVKICGVTTPADARLVAASGADAVGLNFVAGSPRCLSPAVAREVAAVLPAGIRRVGVFAGSRPDDIVRIVRDVGLDTIQLHGHLFADGDGSRAVVDAPELCAALGTVPVIRAVRLEADGLASARRWIEAARALGGRIDMARVDAGAARGADGGQLGGTGARVDWRALTAAGPLPVPMALAGGLTPDNVAEAIRVTGVQAVDTASGVESAPGLKDAAKVRAFVAAARAAFMTAAGGPGHPLRSGSDG